MMRNSNPGSSSINQSDTSFSSPEEHGQDILQEEESGWTAYFDDYFSNKMNHPSASKHIDDMSYDDDDHENGNSHGGSGSAVSDAASCAAWKSQYKNCDARSGTRAEALAACSSFDGTQMVIHKKLGFKKTSRHKRSGEYYDDSLEDTASSPVNSPKAKGDLYGYDHLQIKENGLKQQAVEVNKSLKEKGLCLVPYSMLINYIG